MGYTKGPWKLDQENELDLIGPGHKWIATLHGGYDGDDADAALLSAAPELLEALKAVYEARPIKGKVISRDEAIKIFDEVARVIAKAEGRS